MNPLTTFWKDLCAAWKAGELSNDPYYYFAGHHITLREWIYLSDHPEWLNTENGGSDAAL